MTVCWAHLKHLPALCSPASLTLSLLLPLLCWLQLLFCFVQLYLWLRLAALYLRMVLMVVVQLQTGQLQLLALYM